MPPEEPTDRARSIADEALAKLREDLKAGRSDALKAYLAAMGRFHRYSWTNVMLIHNQRPTATRVAGYHTWHDLGRFVRRGEKGIRIYAPIISKRRAESAPERQGRASPPTPGKDQARTDEPRAIAFRAAYVFDLEQTEGRPLPEFARTTGDPREFTDKLKGIALGRGISLSYDASIAPADGVSGGGEIRLRPGLSPAEEFSVLAHELAHEMLHHGPNRREFSKAVRETQAEAVAYVVSRGVGLETGRAAADYISLYNGDDKVLADSLAAIQEASSKILDELLPREPERRDAQERAARENAPEQDALDSGLPEHSPPPGPDRSDGPSLER
jgi:antirestriction protein ArdC